MTMEELKEKLICEVLELEGSTEAYKIGRYDALTEMLELLDQVK